MSVRFSCVTDGSPKYDFQACLWALTLLRLGGRSPDELVVHTVGPRTPFTDVLARLGVRVASVGPFDERHPHSNKLSQLESEALSDVDEVVLCDCDLAFAGDLGPWIGGDRVRAKMVDLSNPPIEVWREIFRSAGLRGEPRTAIPTNEPTPTYVNNFNGGLYILPRDAFRELGLSWQTWGRWTIDQAHLFGDYANHSDQIAFGLAMEELGLEADPLPISVNFPTHLPYPNAAVPDVDPVALHYHDRIDPSGFLLRVGMERVDAAIDRVNDALAASRRETFDNAAFWEFRYSEFPELGSGLGSRGDSLLAKRALLRPWLDRFRDASVLDVGCGDLEVMEPMSVAHYTGIDVSPAAIDIAKKRHPGGTFLVGELRDLDVPPHDLVICLDVLIHQSRKEEYDGLLAGLVAHTKDWLIVSGYNQAPWLTSEITFYYEPLTDSLRRIGGGTFEIVGGYRDVTVVSWQRHLPKDGGAERGGRFRGMRPVRRWLKALGPRRRRGGTLPPV